MSDYQKRIKYLEEMNELLENANKKNKEITQRHVEMNIVFMKMSIFEFIKMKWGF